MEREGLLACGDAGPLVLVEEFGGVDPDRWNTHPRALHRHPDLLVVADIGHAGEAEHVAGAAIGFGGAEQIPGDTLSA